jgi:hypothetical protein
VQKEGELSSYKICICVACFAADSPRANCSLLESLSVDK